MAKPGHEYFPAEQADYTPMRRPSSATTSRSRATTLPDGTELWAVNRRPRRDGACAVRAHPDRRPHRRPSPARRRHARRDPASSLSAWSPSRTSHTLSSRHSSPTSPALSRSPSAVSLTAEAIPPSLLGSRRLQHVCALAAGHFPCQIPGRRQVSNHHRCKLPRQAPTHRAQCHFRSGKEPARRTQAKDFGTGSAGSTG